MVRLGCNITHLFEKDGSKMVDESIEQRLQRLEEKNRKEMTFRLKTIYLIAFNLQFFACLKSLVLVRTMKNMKYFSLFFSSFIIFMTFMKI